MWSRREVKRSTGTNKMEHAIPAMEVMNARDAPAKSCSSDAVISLGQVRRRGLGVPEDRPELADPTPPAKPRKVPRIPRPVRRFGTEW